MKTLLTWIRASRPHTMGLSFAVILAGSGQVGWQALHFTVLLLALICAAGFQLISNFANDYGDYVKGTDAHRSEGYRSLSGGNLTAVAVKKAIIFLAIISVVAVIVLIAVAPIPTLGKWVIFALGIASIIAAITYTMGKRPYGYYALGDVMVFVFFGWVGVLGSDYLQRGSWFGAESICLALAFGALSTSVLNINNIRDSQKDAENGKKTLANGLGEKAMHYQDALFAVVILGFVGYALLIPYGYLAVLTAGLIVWRLRGALQRANQHSDYNDCLAMTVKSTLLQGIVVFLLGAVSH